MLRVELIKVHTSGLATDSIRTLTTHISVPAFNAHLHLPIPAACRCGHWEAIVMTLVAGFLPSACVRALDRVLTSQAGFPDTLQVFRLPPLRGEGENDIQLCLEIRVVCPVTYLFCAFVSVVSPCQPDGCGYCVHNALGPSYAWIL